jgi:hypothetical protein
MELKSSESLPSRMSTNLWKALLNKLGSAFTSLRKLGFITDKYGLNFELLGKIYLKLLMSDLWKSFWDAWTNSFMALCNACSLRNEYDRKQELPNDIWWGFPILTANKIFSVI